MTGSEFAIAQAFLNRFGTGVLRDGKLRKKDDLIANFGDEMVKIINQFEEGGVPIA
ncbi:hypothetical protein OIT44_04165 [Weissella ceti]|uniref:Uncharacterized protein n=1 Tax=Weissella ceti TaxID=759620 RepID=A0ABT3E4D1_9LACO|nr:hypothetical protein [Weissella ceti]MCW0953270.1 hypothetical protein [Weissella ceti]QVK11380.1 hypothetical protein KHQ31_03925 [Weissella ceti]